MVWIIQCVDGDEWQQMDVGGRMGSNRRDKCRTKRGQTLDRTRIDVGWNNDGRPIKWQRTSNRMMTNIEQNKDGHRMEWRNDVTTWRNGRERMAIATNYVNDGITEQFASAGSIAMVCKRENINIFSLYFLFLFFSLFSFSLRESCYKGYSLHDYKLKNT
jgi:hypothetical protein